MKQSKAKESKVKKVNEKQNECRQSAMMILVQLFKRSAICTIHIAYFNLNLINAHPTKPAIKKQSPNSESVGDPKFFEKI